MLRFAQHDRFASAHPWAIALATFVAAALLYHVPALVLGRVPTQDDLEVFYFPLLVVTGDALREGQLPLWTPLIFGGYPLFADGEAGMLYPLHLLVLPWISPEQALVLLALLHSFLASAFTFAFLRTLGVGLLGAVVGSLVYAYSGFAAGQMVHANVIRSMVWLPLELTLAERMCRATDRSRYRYGLLTGAVFGIQALALHVHITALSALTVAAFVVYRGVVPGSGFRVSGSSLTPDPKLETRNSRSPWEQIRSLGRAAWSSAVLLALIGSTGVGLAAVQLVPLLELAQESDRLAGLSAPLAGTNSLWVGSFLTLFLPRLFDTPLGDFWGLWVKWETATYVGILPLALAGIGLIVRGGPYRAFFGGLGVASILLGLGPDGPLPLWQGLHSLPGFQVLRSPGRFSLLFSLAVAVAASYSVDWLAQRSRSPRWAMAAVLGAAGGVALAAAALALVSQRLHAWAVSGSWLLETYLGLPGAPAFVDGTKPTVARVASLAANALSPANLITLWQLTLALGAAAVVALWLLGPRFRPLAAAVTLALVFSDLWVLGLTFHPSVGLGELRPHVPPLLLERPSAPIRVFTPPTIEEKVSQVDANRLMPFGIQEAAGYSSLQPARHASYVAELQGGDDDLLDLWNVRYVLRQNRPELLPDYQRVSFHSRRPLLGGKLGESGRDAMLLPEGGPSRGDALRIVAALWDAEDVRQGEEVARVVVEPPSGEVRGFPLRAGVHVSDGTIDKPGWKAVAHGRAEVAFDYQQVNPAGGYYGERLFYASLPLEPPLVVSRVRVEQTAREGRLYVYGLGLFDSSTNDVVQVWDRPDLPLVYRDSQIKVYENLDPLPRAFLVGSGVVAPEGSNILARMNHGPFNPRELVLVEEPLPQGVVLPDPNPVARAPGDAIVERYAANEVRVRVTARSPAMLVLSDLYFPGWVARIDGEPTPILQADYLFRAIVVPAGAHTVTFSYEPISLPVGLMLSLATSAIVFVVAGLHATHRRLSLRQ